MTAKIFHNPMCGTSRNTLAIMRHARVEPEVIEYLKDTPSAAELKDLLQKAGLKPRDILRTKQDGYAESGLGDESLSDDAILDLLVANPKYIQRPIVVTDMGVRLARPSEVVTEILPPLPSDFTKEDGEVVKA